MTIRDLMNSSGVAFGTSGARGLATAMTDRVCCAYTRGFLQYLEASTEGKEFPRSIAVAGDFRPSTGRIIEAVARAAVSMGYTVEDCGRIPSPAVALYGLTRKIPSIMVTGSHIPDDRNGIKFNKALGEVLKDDEKGIASQGVSVEDARFDAQGWFIDRQPAPRQICQQAEQDYVARYLAFFPAGCLDGLRIGVYQHSAVGRDLLVTILSKLGAEAIPLGRSEKFIPVDTEAIRAEDVDLARDWARNGAYSAIVSADGDSDRPLASDERGRWLRGDIAGILCARHLGADVVCTPVSCNTAVEKSGWFKEVRRTRIGSPYVIAAMNEATRGGARRVVGYEANGGFLINSDIEQDGRKLRALPTRDAVIVLLSVLVSARSANRRISQLADDLPRRFTASDRLKNFPVELSARVLARFNTGAESSNFAAVSEVFGGLSGRVVHIDRTDGVRITFADGDIIHLRPSGNAPEFRCYTEADREDRAQSLNAAVLRVLSRLAD